MKRSLALVLVFGLILIAAGCGGGGASNSGSGGGTPPPSTSISATSSDKLVELSLDKSILPAGVTSDQITITKKDTPVVSGATVFLAYDFTPDGIQFSSPATLTISLDGLDLGGVSAANLKISLIEDGTITELATTYDSGTNKLSAQITHFCTYGVTFSDSVESECIEGAEQSCGTDDGMCAAGTQTCSGGEWGECVDSVGPEDEACDGEDNDCDGEIDEDDVCGDLVLLLDGDEDRAVATDTLFPTADAHDFTAEAWFYTSSNGGKQVIVSDDAYDIIVDTGIEPNEMIYRIWGPGGNAQVTLGEAVSLNVWHHASLGYDQAAKKMYVSFDGDVRDPLDTDFTAGFYVDDNQIFAVGDMDISNAGLYAFFGKIDEVRISDIVRYTSDFTPAETFTSDANTKGLWHFNEAAGSVSFSDASGNGHTLGAIGDAVTGE